MRISISKCKIRWMLILAFLLPVEAKGQESLSELTLPQLIRMRNDVQNDLKRTLGSEGYEKWEQAHRESEAFREWVEWFKNVEVPDTSVTIASLERSIDQAEKILQGWQDNDKKLGQSAGPQTRAAAERLRKERKKLEDAKDKIDPQIKDLPDLGGIGIETFDELVAEAQSQNENLTRIRRSASQLLSKLSRIEDAMVRPQELNALDKSYKQTEKSQFGEFITTWTFQSGKTFKATWSNNATAKLTIVGLSDGKIKIERYDTEGTSKGLRATYTGTIDRETGKIEGDFTFSLGSKSYTGKWWKAEPNTNNR